MPALIVDKGHTATTEAKKILHHLCKGHGVTPAKLLSLNKEDLETLTADTHEELISKIRTACEVLRFNERYGYMVDAAFNLDQKSDQLLLDRLITSTPPHIKQVDRTTWRRKKECIDRVADFITQPTSIRLAQPSEGLALTPSNSIEMRPEQRVAELEGLMQRLLKSKHVAESTKEMILKYL